MKKMILLFALLLFPLIGFANNSAYVLTVKQGIGPATAEYISGGLQLAHKMQAKLVVIKLDTPGGLDKSMRAIIQAMLKSPVPIATYVFPGGARAASAGTFILYASQIAAMAPGTNLGAATPVSLGGGSKAKKAEKPNDMMKKVTNDAVAYIKSLAELHGRNATWAASAVTKAASLSAKQAYKKNVINVIASDVPELLQKINGRVVKVQGKKVTLKTANLSLVAYKPTWRVKVLGVIASPTIAYLLLLIGIYGIIFELMNPGMIFPGAIGLVSLLFAVYGLNLLPVNYVGLLLLLAGVILMVLEIFVTSFGALAIAGIISFLAGSLLLFKSGSPAFAIALPVVIGITIVTALFFLVVVRIAARSFKRPVVIGKEEILRSEGEVSFIQGDEVFAIFHGERWQVRSKTPLKVGQRLRVLKRDGLILSVEVVV